MLSTLCRVASGSYLEKVNVFSSVQLYNFEKISISTVDKGVRSLSVELQLYCDTMGSSY